MIGKHKKDVVPSDISLNRCVETVNRCSKRIGQICFTANTPYHVSVANEGGMRSFPSGGEIDVDAGHHTPTRSRSSRSMRNSPQGTRSASSSALLKSPYTLTRKEQARIMSIEASKHMIEPVMSYIALRQEEQERRDQGATMDETRAHLDDPTYDLYYALGCMHRWLIEDDGAPETKEQQTLQNVDDMQPGDSLSATQRRAGEESVIKMLVDDRDVPKYSYPTLVDLIGRVGLLPKDFFPYECYSVEARKELFLQSDDGRHTGPPPTEEQGISRCSALMEILQPPEVDPDVVAQVFDKVEDPYASPTSQPNPLDPSSSPTEGHYRSVYDAIPKGVVRRHQHHVSGLLQVWARALTTYFLHCELMMQSEANRRDLLSRQKQASDIERRRLEQEEQERLAQEKISQEAQLSQRRELEFEEMRDRRKVEASAIRFLKEIHDAAEVAFLTHRTALDNAERYRQARETDAERLRSQQHHAWLARLSRFEDEEDADREQEEIEESKKRKKLQARISDDLDDLEVIEAEERRKLAVQLIIQQQEDEDEEDRRRRQKQLDEAWARDNESAEHERSMRLKAHRDRLSEQEQLEADETKRVQERLEEQRKIKAALLRNEHLIHVLEEVVNKEEPIHRREVENDEEAADRRHLKNLFTIQRRDIEEREAAQRVETDRARRLREQQELDRRLVEEQRQRDLDADEALAEEERIRERQRSKRRLQQDEEDRERAEELARLFEKERAAVELGATAAGLPQYKEIGEYPARNALILEEVEGRRLLKLQFTDELSQVVAAQQERVRQEEEEVQAARSRRKKAMRRIQDQEEEEIAIRAKRLADTQARRQQLEAEEEARHTAELEARKRANEEARRAEEEEAMQLAKEESKRRALQQAQQLAEEEAKLLEEVTRKKAEERAKIVEEETRQLAEDEARRRAVEEARRQAEEEAKQAEEARQLAVQRAKRAAEEAKELAEEEARRCAAEEEEIARRSKRLAEAQARRLKLEADEEAGRLAEEEARKLAEEVEARRLAAERKLRQLKEEAQRQQEAEEEAERQREEEIKRLREEEAERQRAEEAKRRKEAEEEAQRRREEEEERRKEEEELARQRRDEQLLEEQREIGRRRAAERRRLELEEKIARRLEEEEDARQKAAEEAERRRKEEEDWEVEQINHRRAKAAAVRQVKSTEGISGEEFGDDLVKRLQMLERENRFLCRVVDGINYNQTALHEHVLEGDDVYQDRQTSYAYSRSSTPRSTITNNNYPPLMILQDASSSPATTSATKAGSVVTVANPNGGASVLSPSTRPNTRRSSVSSRVSHSDPPDLFGIPRASRDEPIPLPIEEGGAPQSLEEAVVRANERASTPVAVREDAPAPLAVKMAGNDDKNWAGTQPPTPQEDSLAPPPPPPLPTNSASSAPRAKFINPVTALRQKLAEMTKAEEDHLQRGSKKADEKKVEVNNNVTPMKYSITDSQDDDGDVRVYSGIADRIRKQVQEGSTYHTPSSSRAVNKAAPPTPSQALQEEEKSSRKAPAAPPATEEVKTAAAPSTPSTSLLHKRAMTQQALAADEESAAAKSRLAPLSEANFRTPHRKLSPIASPVNEPTQPHSARELLCVDEDSGSDDVIDLTAVQASPIAAPLSSRTLDSSSPSTTTTPATTTANPMMNRPASARAQRYYDTILNDINNNNGSITTPTSLGSGGRVKAAPPTRSSGYGLNSDSTSTLTAATLNAQKRPFQQADQERREAEQKRKLAALARKHPNAFGNHHPNGLGGWNMFDQEMRERGVGAPSVGAVGRDPSTMPWMNPRELERNREDHLKQIQEEMMDVDNEKAYGSNIANHGTKKLVAGAIHSATVIEMEEAQDRQEYEIHVVQQLIREIRHRSGLMRPGAMELGTRYISGAHHPAEEDPDFLLIASPCIKLDFSLMAPWITDQHFKLVLHALLDAVVTLPSYGKKAQPTDPGIYTPTPAPNYSRAGAGSRPTPAEQERNIVATLRIIDITRCRYIKSSVVIEMLGELVNRCPMLCHVLYDHRNFPVLHTFQGEAPPFVNDDAATGYGNSNFTSPSRLTPYTRRSLSPQSARGDSSDDGYSRRPSYASDPHSPTKAPPNSLEYALTNKISDIHESNRPLLQPLPRGVNYSADAAIGGRGTAPTTTSNIILPSTITSPIPVAKKRPMTAGLGGRMKLSGGAM